jgi:LemA protein
MPATEECYMNRKWLIPGIIIGIVVIIGGILVSGYNGLVGQRESVNKTFANLQSQYQRRADLVPNLVRTVKGAAEFEQKTLTDVTEARTKATSITIDPSKATPEQLAEYQKSQGELSQALGRLLAITENYPQLKAVQGFQDLQVQLEGTENRIAVARNDFNDVASTYNARILTFPTNITAGLFGFNQFPYFEADEGAENAPEVDL